LSVIIPRLRISIPIDPFHFNKMFRLWCNLTNYFLIFILLHKDFIFSSTRTAYDKLQEATHLISLMSSSFTPNQVCRTCVYVSEEQDLRDLKLPSSATAHVGRFLTAFLHLSFNDLTASSYTTEYEHTTEELLFPLYSVAMRHSLQCQLVFILAKYQGETVGQLTLNIVRGRLVRPHKDYFFYLTSLDSLRTGNIINELRYMYWLNPDNTTSTYLYDSCRAGNFYIDKPAQI